MDLEYIMSNFEIDKEGIYIDEDSPDIKIKQHKFIIEYRKPNLIFHSGFVSKHEEIARNIINLNPNDRRRIIGGARFYINKDILTIDSKSYKYGSIPNSVGEKYSEFIISKLQDIGVSISDTEIKLDQDYLNLIWRELI